jgi:hypothetical protein
MNSVEIKGRDLGGLGRKTPCPINGDIGGVKGHNKENPIPLESPTLCLPALYQNGSGPAVGRGGAVYKKSALMRCTFFVSVQRRFTS